MERGARRGSKYGRGGNMITIDKQNDRLGDAIAYEIRTNGPGTAKQIAKAIGTDEGYALRKLIGMKRDGDLIGWTPCANYCIFGLADW